MKILVLCNAHALAHVSRPLEIAKVLRARGHETIFAGHGQYLRVAAEAGFGTRELPFISLQQMLGVIRREDKPWRLYPYEQLQRFMGYELALYAELRPDLVLIDCRLTAATSAELARIPSVSLLNVHMSAHKKIPFFTLRRPGREGWLRRLGDRLLHRLERLTYHHLVVAKMARLRRSMGLSRRTDYLFEEGDLTLFPDLPHFNPVQRLPDHCRYIGPLTWQPLSRPALELPPLPRGGKRIYLTVGSTSLDHLFAELARLRRPELQFVVSTAGVDPATLPAPPDNIVMLPFVDADALLPRADLMICHGGNGTLYQAMRHGVPVVGAATHGEQYHGLQRINQLGAGIGFSPKEQRRGGLRLLLEAAEEVLGTPRYRENMQQIQREMTHWDGPRQGAALIEAFVAGGRVPEAETLSLSTKKSERLSLHQPA